MKKTGKVLTILGICLCILLAISLLTFGFGLFAFVALGEERYFAQYVTLNGYFPIVNFMFLLDYLCMGIGFLGIPTLVTGLILKNVAKKAD